MNATNKLLDKYALACSVAMDKDLAARLRVTKQAVSNWRKGNAHPDAESVARMCETTGEQIAHWLPLIEAERARSPEAKKVWLRLAQMAAAVALTVGLFPAHAEAATTAAGHAAQSSPVYIMRNLICGVGLARRSHGAETSVFVTPR